jgi:hypothetical protein
VRPIDVALAATGHLLVLTQDGRILRSNSVDPTGPSAGFELWAEGIEDPIDLTVDGLAVRVRTANEVVLLVDSEGLAIESVGGSRGQGSLFFDRNARQISDFSGNRYHVGASEGIELFRVETGESTTVWDEHIERPGPAMFTRDWLYLSGISDDGHSLLVRLDADNVDAGNDDVEPVVSFERGSKIRALERGSRSHWPILEQNSLLIAVQYDGRGSLYLLSEDSLDGVSELVECATGFQAPSALAFGLDGSLFVADTERGQIVRISYAES